MTITSLGVTCGLMQTLAMVLLVYVLKFSLEGRVWAYALTSALIVVLNVLTWCMG